MDRFSLVGANYDFVRSNLYRSTCKDNDKDDNCKISPNQGCCPSVQLNSNLCTYLHSPGHNLHKINQITHTYPKYMKRDSTLELPFESMRQFQCVQTAYDIENKGGKPVSMTSPRLKIKRNDWLRVRSQSLCFI